MIVRKVHTWFRLSRGQRRLALTGIAAVGLARVGLWLLSFRTLQRACQYLGRWSRSGGQAGLRDIAWAIRLASRYVPRSTCLVQALAAQVLLGSQRMESRLNIGVALGEEGNLDAHAWVESQGAVVTGDCEHLDRYAQILAVDSRQHHN